MIGIDGATLGTHTSGGESAGCPMSNNGDVQYGGDSVYFTTDDSSDAAVNPDAGWTELHELAGCAPETGAGRDLRRWPKTGVFTSFDR
jgi:hypothetical protein